jgi:2-polyprenyl-3-methyl-5-hydroxy-6-metoxy-1,4-benzoquinol methylase
VSHGQLACEFCFSPVALRWATANIVRCSSCGLLFRHPAPSNESLKRLYEASWIDPASNPDETGSTEIRLARVYAQHLARVLNRESLSGLQLLEFGAGKGDMLLALQELGARTCAVEPFGITHLAQRNLEVFPTLESIPPIRQFDGIVALEVLEHLSRPWLEIRRLKERLYPSGWLLLSTPNAASLNARLLGPRWREVAKTGHLVFFTSTSLTNVLLQCGFPRVTRLRWLIPYSEHPLLQCKDYALQLLRADGSLRYLAYASD